MSVYACPGAIIIYPIAYHQSYSMILTFARKIKKEGILKRLGDTDVLEMEILQKLVDQGKWAGLFAAPTLRVGA